MRIRARNVIGRDPDGSFVLAPHDADQAGVVGGKLVGPGLQTIDQSTERGIDETLMSKTSQHRRLPAPRYGAALRHIGGLVKVSTDPAAVRS